MLNLISDIVRQDAVFRNEEWSTAVFTLSARITQTTDSIAGSCLLPLHTLLVLDGCLFHVVDD